MFRIALITILIIFIIAVGFQLVLFIGKNKKLKAELAQVNEKFDFFESENEKIKQEIDFLSRSENLEKELKSKFNYKKAGEEMIIVVP